MKTTFGIWFFALLATKILAQPVNGLVGEYYDGKSFERLIGTRTDSRLRFAWGRGQAPMAGMNPEAYSVRWTGQILAPESGEYMFRAVVDDGIRVWINGVAVIDAWGMNDSERFTGKIYLEKGKYYSLKVAYFNGLYEGEISLNWQLPSQKPYFNGTFGYNDQPIDGKYFFKPAETSKPLVKATPPPKKPAKKTPPKPAPAKQQVVRDTTPALDLPPKDTIERYTPKNILFEQSKSTLNEAAHAELERLAVFLKKYPALRITISGHTDNIGKPEDNRALSQRRVDAVSAFLISCGVDSTRIQAIGYGDTKPLIVDGKKGGHPQNRRVVFQINP